MQTSKIAWCDYSLAGAWLGCQKKSAGCDNCYAAAMDLRFHRGVNWRGQRMDLRERFRTEMFRLQKLAANNLFVEVSRNGVLVGRGSLRSKAFLGSIQDGDRVERVRPRVFCNAASDWLDPEVPAEWLADMMNTVRRCDYLDCLLLTKRPELWAKRVATLAQFRDIGSEQFAWELEWYGQNNPPANVWIGCTVENQPMADERMPELLKIPARVRFLSCEPLLGPVMLNLGNRQFGPDHLFSDRTGIDGRIHWVICGGESGPKARPMDTDWARSLRGQCAMAGVPFFFKQHGEWLHADQMDDATSTDILDPSEWFRYANCSFGGGVNDMAYKVGKKAAGHLLDGVEYHEFPRIEGGAR